MKLKRIQGNKVPLTKENVLARVEEADLFHKYLGIKPGKKSYRNPLRKDNNPTCSFYKSERNNRLMFHDFGMGRSWDCFAVIMTKFNLGFWQALEKVNEDYQLRLGTCDPTPPLKAKETKELKKVIKEKPVFTWIERSFDEDDLIYWNSQGVEKTQLRLFNVIAVEKVYLNNSLMAISTKKNPIYAYTYPSSGNIKFYRPLTPLRADKWFGNVTTEDINGYDQLPYVGDLLILTKSLKDVMALHNLGYTAIAPQGEGNRIELNNQLQAVIPFFDDLVILYDNDKAGREHSARISEALKCPSIEIPEELGTKDVAETIQKWKKKRTKKLLKTLIQNSQKE
jgi:hypothetical protein